MNEWVVAGAAVLMLLVLFGVLFRNSSAEPQRHTRPLHCSGCGNAIVDMTWCETCQAPPKVDARPVERGGHDPPG